MHVSAMMMMIMMIFYNECISSCGKVQNSRFGFGLPMCMIGSVVVGSH